MTGYEKELRKFIEIYTAMDTLYDHDYLDEREYDLKCRTLLRTVIGSIALHLNQEDN